MPRALTALVLLLALFSGQPRAEGNLVPDLRLLVDVSAHMEDLDPKGLGLPALEMVIRLLPAGTRVGIWVFAEEAQQLVPSGEVNAQWREQALDSLAGIAYRGERTNIPAALEAATADLADQLPGYRSSVVLLTSGKVDVAESPMLNVSASRKLLNGLAVELGKSGVPVHTIAFTRQADSMLLRSLARETGGTSRQAEDASELGNMFLRVMEMVLPSDREPLAGNVFSIDPRVTEFTVLTVFPGNRGRLRLIDPSGTEFTAEENPGDIRWFRNRQYTTAQLYNPQQGNWRLQYPAKTNARVFVTSDLELRVGALAYFTPVGHEAKVRAYVTDGGERITDPAFLAQFELSLDVTTPQGTRQSYEVGAPSADGYYQVSTPALQLPGRYRLMVRLMGEDIQRELPVFIEVEIPRESPTLITRGEAPPEDDFQAPMLWLAGVSSIVIVAVWFVLRRRKQRKLALWQKRAREISNGAASGTTTGTAALDEPRRSLD